MAEIPSNKSKNSEFLKKLDQQRLMKKCTRIIDLRGKVRGECRPYLIGGLTHYLDDRAYLLIKKLLTKFNEQYTVGVYETLLKAIKKLESDSRENQSREDSPILTRKMGEPQAIGFHRIVNRKEPRITHTTEINVRVDDVEYTASTIDITTSSIKITLKRVYTLSKGASVLVRFNDFYSDETAFLNDLSYSILKIDHDEMHTFLILIRNRNNNIEASEWLDEWAEENNTLSKRDLDNELINIASRFYLRLYGIVQNRALFWLSSQPVAKVELFNLTYEAFALLDPLTDLNHKVNASLLPFDRLVSSEKNNYILVTYLDNNLTKCIITPTDNISGIQKGLKYFTPSSHIFLLQPKSVSMGLGELETSMAHLNNIDAPLTSQLTQQLEAITHLVSFTDITQCLEKLRLATDAIDTSEHNDTFQPSWQGDLPEPAPIQPYIKPDQPRFVIRTTINVNLAGQDYEIVTSDVSERGLSFTVNTVIDIPVDNTIFISFISWQKQTTTVDLNELPYLVKNVKSWQGKTKIGLARKSRSCKGNVNTLFKSIIDRNQSQLSQNAEAEFLSQRSKVLNTQLGRTSRSIPLFWGTDEENKRIIQAYAVNEYNEFNHAGFWKAFQTLTSKLTIDLKLGTEQSQPIISSGIYTYQDVNGEWQISMDNQFENIAQKSLFISRALQASNHRFFNCALTSLKPSVIDQQADLSALLISLRSHSSHKVKVIRDVLYSLFAIGELTDITDVMTAVYQESNNL
jgi:hypothetical protein